MLLQTQRWYDAIPKRHSTRTFECKDLSKEHKAAMEQICTEFTMPGARAVFVDHPTERIFRGIVGSYGKITGAPSFVAFIGDEVHPHMMVNAGFLGEAVILEATAMGLATCWVGGFFYPQEVEQCLRLAPGEKILAVSPVGYESCQLGFKDLLFKKLARSHKRKDLQRITTGLSSEQWPDWVRVGLEAARLAPSAVNRQPWVFAISNCDVTLAMDGPDLISLSKKLDCGIAMLHFELGANAAGVQGDWQYLHSPQIVRFTPKRT